MTKGSDEHDRTGEGVSADSEGRRTRDAKRVNGRLEEESAERKRAEETLRQSEERFRSTFEDAPIGMEILGLEGRLLRVNRSLCSIVGYSESELLEKTFQAITHPDDTAAEVDFINQTLAGETNRFEMEKRYIHKLGHTAWAFVTGSIVRNSEGKPLHLVIQVQDITERKEAEEKIRTLNEDLRHHAAELEAANKELEAFAYSVSHDLRAPLRSIDGFGQILVEDYSDKLDEEGLNTLAVVRGETQRMGQLIDDLLRLSRVTRVEMEHEEVNLSALAKSVAAELQQSAPDRNVECVIASDLKAQGDSRLLRLALANLLGNAWKFTSKHPSAKVEFGQEKREDSMAFYVRDDGAGFDMAYVGKLFAPFQRLHSTSEFAGTGVGLAIVQRVIHRHGGRVWAEGSMERGATFYFTL